MREAAQTTVGYATPRITVSATSIANATAHCRKNPDVMVFMLRLPHSREEADDEIDEPDPHERGDHASDAVDE